MGNVSRSAQHKNAVITGGSRGIGLAAAETLAGAGYQILLCSRSDEAVRGATEKLQRDGAKVFGISCDVSSEADVAMLVSEAKRLLGPVDVLFNNAGSGKVVSLEATSMELWSHTIGSSLTGTFLCCRAFLPLLKQAPSPIIINNASVSANRGFPGFAAYSAAKGGVAALSRAIREELRADGIRVTTLYPGATDSPFWEAVDGEWDRSRMMTCEDVGKVILQIAETNACAMVEEIHLMPAGGVL